MSAIIELFPLQKRGPRRRADEAMRYVRRAEEALQLLVQARTGPERVTLCDIAELWLDLAEGVLPADGQGPT